MGVSRKLRPQTSKTQYSFDENSCMVLIFPTVFDYWHAKLLSSAVSCLSISIAELATRTGNSQTHASFVDLGSMIAWWNVSVFEIYFFVLNKSNIKYMDWVVLVVWRRLFGRPCNFLKKRENERNRERKGSEYITHVVLNSLILVEIEMLGHLHRRSSFQIIIV